MRLGTTLAAAGSIAAVLPLAAILYATPVSCCFGTACVEVPGCSKTITYVTSHCKRVCSEDCTEGDGCCQWEKQTCTYSGEDCPGPRTQNGNVTLYRYKQCRNNGVEVECLVSADSECANP